MDSIPFGRHLLNRILPSKFKVSSSLNSKEFNNRLTELAKEDPTLYTKIIGDLKRQGDQFATMEGLSVGLDDIEPNYALRDRVINPVMEEVKRTKDYKRQRDILAQTQKAFSDFSLKHPGSLSQQVASGSRGKPAQLMKIVATPVLATDSEEKVIPWAIKHSYAEGLKPSEYYITGNEARMNTIKSNTSVSEPGDLSKILINNMTDLLVTELDCGTSNGIVQNVSSSDVIDRYLAKPIGKFDRNTLITPQVKDAIKKISRQIVVRSATTCEAHEGVCQKCYGIESGGTIPEVGTNLGIRSAQALSEPLTQFALNAKHGVRLAKGDKKVLEGITGLRQLIEVPQVFINKAIVASQEGKIRKIEIAPQGGKNVYIGTSRTPHYIPPNLKVLVKTEQKVEAGDSLSEGVPKPDEIVKLKGLGDGRKHIVEVLKDLYKTEGQDVDQRHFELLAKSNLNYARILDDENKNFMKGDIVSYNTLKKNLQQSIQELPVNEAIGEKLGKEYFHYTVGTNITPSKARYLRTHGINRVMIADKAPEIEFIMKPATRNPLLNPDWMARLAHRYLKRSILEGAHFGEISKLHGNNPIPAYAYGLEFGKGDRGRY